MTVAAVKAIILGAALAMVTLATARAEGQRIAVTGYTCDPAHGQPYCGATASGAPVGPGVAACPAWMRFGTVLAIEGVGVVTCLDRGPAGAVDVFLPTIEDCYRITGVYAYEVVG